MLLRNVGIAAHANKINTREGAQHQHIMSLYVSTGNEDVKIFKETEGKTPSILNSTVEIKDSIQYSYHEGEPWSSTLVLTKLP